MHTRKTKISGTKSSDFGSEHSRIGQEPTAIILHHSLQIADQHLAAGFCPGPVGEGTSNFGFFAVLENARVAQHFDESSLKEWLHANYFNTSPGPCLCSFHCFGQKCLGKVDLALWLHGLIKLLREALTFCQELQINVPLTGTAHMLGFELLDNTWIHDTTTFHQHRHPPIPAQFVQYLAILWGTNAASICFPAASMSEGLRIKLDALKVSLRCKLFTIHTVSDWLPCLWREEEIYEPEDRANVCHDTGPTHRNHRLDKKNCSMLQVQ